MASGIYNYFKAHILDAEYNLGSGGDTIRVALMNNSHTFTAENDTWADVSANEASGTGYTANGYAFTTPTVSIDDTDDEGVFDAEDVTWSTATITAYHAVIYDDTHASNALICSIDFGGAKASSAGDFTIQWDVEGIINIT